MRLFFDEQRASGSGRCSSFGSCTSLRPRSTPSSSRYVSWLQFLRELHFIEASTSRHTHCRGRCCSSFGSCTSLRPGDEGFLDVTRGCSSFGSCTSLRQADRSITFGPLCGCSSFGSCTSLRHARDDSAVREVMLQFLRELHFIEAGTATQPSSSQPGCSSFGSCTSLRLVDGAVHGGTQ